MSSKAKASKASAAPAAKAGKAAKAPPSPPPPPKAAVVEKAKNGAAAHFAAGQRARCIGLQGSPELNGKTCTLQKFLVEKGRWEVRLEDSTLRNLKPDNLEAIAQAAPAAGKAASAKAAVSGQEDTALKRKVLAAGKAPLPKHPKAEPVKPGTSSVSGAPGSAAAAAKEACSKCGHEFECAGSFCNHCGTRRGSAPAPPLEEAAPKAVSIKEAKKSSKEEKSAGKRPSPTKDDKKNKKQKTQAGGKDEAPADNSAAGDAECVDATIMLPKRERGKKKSAVAAGPLKPLASCLAVPSEPQSPGPTKRLNSKTPGSSIADMPASLVLRRMAALGEAGAGAKDGEMDDKKAEEAVAKSMAEAVKAAEKNSAKELKSLRETIAFVEEMQGEGGANERVDTVKTEKKPREARVLKEGEEDDELFDVEDDLEDEEEISDLSDMEELAEDEGEDLDADWKPVGELCYPNIWEASNLKPGDVGFNSYAAKCLPNLGLGTEKSLFNGFGMRLHQESAASLVHPSSPIGRLLVDHATGTGKTFIMIRMLDNFFDDPRPKVAIFPKDRVCDNFYMEMMKWPSRWREFFAFSCPEEAALASGAANWKRKRMEVWDLNNERLRQESKRRHVRLEKIVRELVDAVRKALEMKFAIRHGEVRPGWAVKFMKTHPGACVPRAPMRAFRYTTAGGRAAELGEDGWPNSPILKVGFSKKELNPFSGKVVIMDECHNLVRPTKQFEEQMGRLRTYLYGARRTVLAGFTGTPVGNDANEGRLLLNVMKGEEAVQGCDEGFVSSFHARGSGDFCREEPVKGIPDGIIHEGMFDSLVKKHSLHGEALKRYLLKETEFAIVPRLLRLDAETRQARMANYCNLHIHYGRCWGTQKEALLNDVKDHAPKMHAIVRSIAKSKEKAVVMLAREMGYKTMLEVLRKTGKKFNFRVATMEELTDFNDPKRNLHGERFRVMLAETAQAGEGVQFKHVRHIYLMDVPMRHSDLVQRASRCVRMGGHAALPPEERVLTIEMHVAHLPKFLKTGPGSLIYRELLNAKEVHKTSGKLLEAATDACLEHLWPEAQRFHGQVRSLEDMQKQLQRECIEKLQGARCKSCEECEKLTRCKICKVEPFKDCEDCEKLQGKAGRCARCTSQKLCRCGEKLIDMLTEIALENFKDPGETAHLAARPLAMALWRLRRGGDDLQDLEKALIKSSTADDIILDWLMDKSAELLPPLEAMRLGAVDRCILAPLGDPPKAPPPRSEFARKKGKKALAALKPDAAGAVPSTAAPAAADEGEDQDVVDDGGEAFQDEADDKSMENEEDIDPEDLVDDEEAEFLADLAGSDGEAGSAGGDADEGAAASTADVAQQVAMLVAGAGDTAEDAQ